MSHKVDTFQIELKGLSQSVCVGGEYIKVFERFLSNYRISFYLAQLKDQ
jgi:hypothetical protein